MSRENQELRDYIAQDQISQKVATQVLYNRINELQGNLKEVVAERDAANDREVGLISKSAAMEQKLKELKKSSKKQLEGILGVSVSLCSIILVG